MSPVMAAPPSKRANSPSATKLDDPLLTISEVLWELREEPEKPLARSTFDRWRALGNAPKCIKLPNGSLRIRRSALERFLRGCEER